VRNSRGFTLIEIAISVFIMLLLLLLAVPSLTGVLADRRLHRTLEAMDELVQQAQQRSVLERRPYLVVWNKDSIVLRPESFGKDEEDRPITVLQLKPGDAFQLSLPTALEDDPPAEWVFWPSGTCDPAVIRFKGTDGSWTASYSPLTARPELSNYAAR
jgi:prepilin-type N-terminal cleavage/methylation domain-containing protein